MDVTVVHFIVSEGCTDASPPTLIFWPFWMMTKMSALSKHNSDEEQSDKCNDLHLMNTFLFRVTSLAMPWGGLIVVLVLDLVALWIACGSSTCFFTLNHSPQSRPTHQFLCLTASGGGLISVDMSTERAWWEVVGCTPSLAGSDLSNGTLTKSATSLATN